MREGERCGKGAWQEVGEAQAEQVLGMVWESAQPGREAMEEAEEGPMLTLVVAGEVGPSEVVVVRLWAQTAAEEERQAAVVVSRLRAGAGQVEEEEVRHHLVEVELWLVMIVSNDLAFHGVLQVILTRRRRCPWPTTGLQLGHAPCKQATQARRTCRGRWWC